MAKPKSLIYIEIVPGGPRLRYAQRGGGVFNSLKTAQYRMDQLDRSGINYKVFTTGHINWQELDPDE